MRGLDADGGVREGTVEHDNSCHTLSTRASRAHVDADGAVIDVYALIGPAPVPDLRNGDDAVREL